MGDILSLPAAGRISAALVHVAPSMLDKVCMVATAMCELNALPARVLWIEIGEHIDAPTIHIAPPAREAAFSDRERGISTEISGATNFWVVLNGCQVKWSVARSAA